MNILTTPREIQIMIFGHLEVSDLVRVSETCHRLKDVARDPCLWKKLTMTYENIKNKNEACRNHVSRCSSLREIFITGEETVIRSDKIMAVVMKAKTTLTSINLSPRFAGLSNSSIERIGEMTQLTHLSVGGGKLKQGGIAALACLTELRSLKVPGIMFGNFVFGGNDDLPRTPMAVFVDLFSTLKKLEEVEIQMSRNYPSDLVVESLVKNNPNLHHLDISNLGCDYLHNPIDELSDRSILLLADKCPQLTYIGIGNLNMFSRTSISTLVGNCPRLKHANFEETMVDDTVLDIMSKKCPDLEYLKISRDRITQDGLERFVYPAHSANLKSLHISIGWEFPMDFSPQFMERLKNDLPNLKIFNEADEDDHDDYSYDSDESPFNPYENYYDDYYNEDYYDNL